MTQTTVNRIAVACRPEKAFDYVADFTSHPLWSPDHIRVAAVDAGPTAVGSRLSTVGYSVVAGGDSEAELEVTDLDRPRRFAFVARSFGQNFENVFTFAEDQGGTLIERRMTFPVAPQAAARLEALGAVLDERRNASLAMLKALLERQSCSVEGHIDK